MTGPGPTGTTAANPDQLKAWDGDTGEFWAENADRFDAGVAAHHARLLAAAAISETDAVLDVGCGRGQTTRDAARRATAGSALGVDLSSRLLGLARDLAERDGLANVTFQQADAQTHPFPERHFDLAVSRHGCMFFADPEAAFANIARALRPGGRLVLVTWQPLERNEWQTSFRAALSVGRELPVPPSGTPGPFSMSEPDAVRGLLGSAGFVDVAVGDLREPMYFGADVDDAFGFVAGQCAWMLRDLDEATTARALAALRADLTRHRTDRGVRYDSAALLIEARRP